MPWTLAMEFRRVDEVGSRGASFAELALVRSVRAEVAAGDDCATSAKSRKHGGVDAEDHRGAQQKHAGLICCFRHGAGMDPQADPPRTLPVPWAKLGVAGGHRTLHTGWKGAETSRPPSFVEQRPNKTV
eukprot:scaffold172_cov254-Pinguiococcus_pyrenoidosus.AAC.42